MFTRHISQRLAPYLDGRLTPQESRRIARHLEQCAKCREQLALVRGGMESIDALAEIEAPESVWCSIEASLNETRARRSAPASRRRWALAALIALLAGAVVFWRFTLLSGARWEVVRVQGAPSLGAKPLGAAGQIGSGEWLETDANSRALVRVGQIGSVEVAPNTRLRVLATEPSKNRLALARGEIHASISAPPKLFFVDTAAGTAVDLGCEYSLTADETGSGVLKVTRGWVSFQWQRFESQVPAGASCKIRPLDGPGIPYFDDAPERLKEAIDNYGIAKTADSSLDVILSEARVRDTLTLWHLLIRADPAGRGRVFDRMTALAPLPAGVSREKALLLDPATLQRWKEELAWKW